MSSNRFALVIDDSVSIRNFISTVLRQDERIGGQVYEAESPEQALRLLAQLEGDLDFIVSDWNMPGMPLPEFVTNIKSTPRFASTPLFLLTGESEAKVLNIAESVGAQAVLRKPFTPEQLVTSIMSAIPTLERRRAQRIVPLVCCEVDLGFEHHQANYSAAVINVSESGLLLRLPLPERGAAQIYDDASLILFAANCPPIKLKGQVVRIEADRSLQGPSIRMAFEFHGLDQPARDGLRNFILLNNPTHGAMTS